ncbi:MAG: hypothetical protein ACK5LZ_04850 [Anaerorhabdus sp.]
MKKFIASLIVSLFILTGCQKSSVDVVFKEVVEINTFIDACGFIESVNGISIEETQIENRNILLDDVKIICSDAEYSALGVFEVEYSVNGKKIYTEVEITDTTAPNADIKSEYKVEVGNLYFNLVNEIAAEDNFSEVEIKILGDVNLEEVGNYSIFIQVFDTSGNKLEKSTTIKVVEKEKEIVEVIVTTPATNNNSNSSGQVAPESGSSGSGSTGSNSSGSSGQVVPENNSPFLSGVKNITIKVNSSLGDLSFKLSSGVNASAAISVDYSAVNLSVPGRYTVNYYTDDGQSASCVVEVVE